MDTRDLQTPADAPSGLKGRAAPRVVAHPQELRAAVATARKQSRRIGLVPTMGALHAGHLSLVEAALADGLFTVVSVFVNPTQFGPQEDFARYPRDLPADLELLARRGADLVFTPTTETMYPPNHETSVQLTRVAKRWEGASRPGHFPGVATVVLKLFHLVAADVALFGHKDYQQTRVIKRMVQDLDLPIEIRVCPTVREVDGLALSSRNAYLTSDQRRQALALSQSLRCAAELVAAGESDAAILLKQMQAVFAAEPAVELDYLAIVDPETLEPLDLLQGPAVALVAARVGQTRLIDNWPLVPPQSTVT